ncbi:hypothetical protein Vadar_003777 [Vaccinium darrowii]|uniref:Uncharacterized protein n=1 Tax=Vaccinium darrowii TaxID=229202 RepID=A0ACB7YIX5_9ERIC|nr:hypothetical protein Vadar_003777 [Vaccinium darrowii]
MLYTIEGGEKNTLHNSVGAQGPRRIFFKFEKLCLDGRFETLWPEVTLLSQGCIAESYIVEEAVEFCTNYLSGLDAIGVPVARNMTFDGTGIERPLLGGKVVAIDHEEWEQAHIYVLQNTSEVEPYIESSGVKKVIEYNDKGHPIGENSKKYASYLGVLARTMVPISHGDWFKVPPHIKVKLWSSVEAAFVVDPRSENNDQQKRQSFNKYPCRLSRKDYSGLEEELGVPKHLPKQANKVRTKDDLPPSNPKVKKSKQCKLAVGSVENIISHDALLPIPVSRDATLTGDVVGYEAAWLRNLALVGDEGAVKHPPKQANKTPSKHLGLSGDKATSKNAELESIEVFFCIC